MNSIADAPRNLGPDWSFGFLSWAEGSWPKWVLRAALMIGTWAGLARLPAIRGHSRDYLTVVLGRPPRLIEQWRHFFAYVEFFMLQVRASRGETVRCLLDEENAVAFESLLRSDRPALFGSFHFGSSDMLGYLLGARGRHVSMLRLRVGNSVDTHLLGRRFGQNVSFLWVNDPAHMFLDLKAALDAGESLAMKCDRFEFSSKIEPFRFLGAWRLFPFTVYHLALIYNRPVVFCVAVAGGKRDELRVFSSPVFTPDPALPREASLDAARVHFQAVLVQLETLVRRNPELWFNFVPLNPEAPAAPSVASISTRSGGRQMSACR